MVSKGLGEAVAASYASLFFWGMTIGRISTGFVANRAGDAGMIRIGGIILLIGIISVPFVPVSYFWVVLLLGPGGCSLLSYDDASDAHPLWKGRFCCPYWPSDDIGLCGIHLDATSFRCLVKDIRNGNFPSLHRILLPYSYLFNREEAFSSSKEGNALIEFTTYEEERMGFHQ